MKHLRSKSLLGVMLGRQREQQRNFFTGPELSETERRRVIADLLLGLHSQVGSVQRLIHRSYHVLHSPVGMCPTKSVTHELVDCLKYLLAIATTLDIEADEIVETFWQVSDAVDDRWRRERTQLADERVLAIDIDGCLANFFDGFARWFFENKIASGDFAPNDINSAWMEEHKQEFYASGGFSKLEPIPGAAQVVRDYAAKGFKIAIITARPRRRHPNVESETIGWLREHHIPFDLLVFNRDKAEAICEHVFPANVFAFIEDRAKHAIEVAALGVPVLLMSSEVDDGIDPEHNLITRVETWAEIRNELRRHSKKGEP
jgi:uncharacterized HAD superfamily protein